MYATAHINSLQKHTSNSRSRLLTRCCYVEWLMQRHYCMLHHTNRSAPTALLSPSPTRSLPPPPPPPPPRNLTCQINVCRQEAEDLLTTAAAVAAARAQASADKEEAHMASALTAVCQVATNALEVCEPICVLHTLPQGTGSTTRSPRWSCQLLQLYPTCRV